MGHGVVRCGAVWCDEVLCALGTLFGETIASIHTIHVSDIVSMLHLVPLDVFRLDLIVQ